MRYIASINSDMSELERVKNLLIVSNPVLEAYGNAQTIRNDNSSRFVSHWTKHDKTVKYKLHLF